MNIGDTLWFVPSHRLGGQPREEVIIKISKLWVHTDHGGRFKTSEMCGRYGKYFQSIEEYDADERRRWAWARLIRLLSKAEWICPNNVSAEDIYEAAGLLRLNLLDERRRA